jgi:hypothetical protein
MFTRPNFQSAAMELAKPCDRTSNPSASYLSVMGIFRQLTISNGTVASASRPYRHNPSESTTELRLLAMQAHNGAVPKEKEREKWDEETL